jgi:DNA-binding transcriptional ArsR family regulator
MSNSPDADRYDSIFKALGNGTRRSILDTLRDQPLTTGALVALFPDLDRCTVMQHLNVLEGADLILVERQGRSRLNHLNPLPIHAIHERWIGPHAKAAVGMLATLKHDLERAG